MPGEAMVFHTAVPALHKFVVLDYDLTLVDRGDFDMFEAVS